MNGIDIRVAKIIDYWVGIPVCFVFTLLHRFRKFLTGTSKLNSYTPRRIMFLKLSEIGSTILLYPAFIALKKKYPQAELYFWIFRENKEVLSILGIVPEENIFTIRGKSISLMLWDTLRTILLVRKERMDILIDAELFPRFSSILSYLSGAKFRAGFYKYTLEGLYRGNFYTHRVVYNPYLHISNNFNTLVDSLCIMPDDIPLVKTPSLREEEFRLPNVLIEIGEKERMLDKLKSINKRVNLNTKIILMNIGFHDKIPIRRWLLEYYIKLISLLMKAKDIIVVIVGIGDAGDEDPFSKYENCINLLGKTTIRELLSLFNISQAIISHDSGIIHLASLSNIYIIALFGPETPILYGPLKDNKKVFYKKFTCSPCLSAYNHRSSICKDNKCMQAITVDEVYAVVKEHIQI